MKKNAFTRVMLTGIVIFVPLLLFSVFFLNPKMGAAAITTLLISMFFSLLCLVAIAGFFFRVKKSNNELLYEAIRTSLRQGFLVGIYVVSILGLAGIKLLTWWDALLLALSLVLFEIYFKSGKENIT
jgi:amino acid transporter